MNYLTEVQQYQMRARTNELPERSKLLPAYPPGRLRGTVRLASGQIISAPNPTPSTSGAVMRVFPFVCNQVGTRRTVIACGPIVGPALIRGIEFYHGTHATPVTWTMEIGYSTTNVTAASELLTTPRSYTNLIELQDPFNIVAQAGGDGLTDGSLPNTLVRYERPLGLLLPVTARYAVLAIVNNSAAAEEVQGTLRVIENYDPSANPAFL